MKTKQATQGSKIVMDGWAGAYKHAHTHTHTQTHTHAHTLSHANTVTRILYTITAKYAFSQSFIRASMTNQRTEEPTD